MQRSSGTPASTVRSLDTALRNASTLVRIPAYAKTVTRRATSLQPVLLPALTIEPAATVRRLGILARIVQIHTKKTGSVAPVDNMVTLLAIIQRRGQKTVGAKDAACSATPRRIVRRMARASAHGQGETAGAAPAKASAQTTTTGGWDLPGSSSAKKLARDGWNDCSKLEDDGNAWNTGESRGSEAQEENNSHTVW